MSLPWAFAIAATSAAALGYLAWTDPKRRRAFRFPAAVGRRPRVALAALICSGAVAAAILGAGGFFIWLGAASVFGWAVAATPPGRAEDRLRALTRRLGKCATGSE